MTPTTMTKRAPMSGIIRLLDDVKSFAEAVEFDYEAICNYQGNFSHSNRQNNRNLVKRCIAKGFLAEVFKQGGKKAASSSEKVFTMTPCGIKFLAESKEKLSNNISISHRDSPSRVKKAVSVERRNNLLFSPSMLIKRVPNTIFNLASTSFEMPEMSAR